MLRNEKPSDKITVKQRAQLAFVYIRQSSPGQVLRHQESTDLQYKLVDRAIQLGWPRDRIELIDDDLGVSARMPTERFGFQRLLAEISLGKVGLVLSQDASRLARNNHDWYQLLEVCSIFGTLIADSEQVYDPLIYTDRLLLGLSGLMSEAELHQLKRRLLAGLWNKAERGELKLRLPVGLLRLPHGEVILNPDEEIQARLRLVFDKFTELRAANAVLRYCQHENLWLPTRPLRGPGPHEVIWHPLSSHQILTILKNPAYAGAFVFGMNTTDPTRRKPGHPHSGKVNIPLDQWPVIFQNAYPAYISWETFLANQAQLASNQSSYHRERKGVPRKG